MKKEFFSVVAIFITSSLTAVKAETLTAGYDYTSYSNAHGSRNLVFTEFKKQIEKGAVVFNFSESKRDYGNDKSWDAIRGRVSLWYSWNEWLSSRTSVALSENTPVFSRRDLQQDISLKVLPTTLFTLGYRYADYYNDTSVNAFSGKVSVYTGPFITSWRYTSYNTDDARGSYSHTIALRMNDNSGAGNTQLWLSRGTGAYAYDWTTDIRKGTLKGLSLRRVQPLTDKLSLGVTLGKQWYETPVENYHSLQMAADISWQF